MSKASNYHQRIQAIREMCPKLHMRSERHSYGMARVDDAGFLDLGFVDDMLPAEHAVELAKWILDTFGEAHAT